MLTPFLHSLAATPLPDPGPLPAILFYTFAIIVLIGAAAVALAKNIVRAATGLLFALAGMSGFYFLLHAEFLAAVQLVVYVGGTLILIIFGVMLTSKNPNISYNPKRLEVLWATLIAALITGPLILLVATIAWPQPQSAQPLTTYSIRELGRALIDPTGYLAPFELVSVVLLAVMIGAAYLAKARKNRPANEPPPPAAR